MVGESLLMLFVTLSCFSSTSPQNLQDYLPTEVNTLSSSNLDIHQSQLPENVHLVAASLDIINQDIRLVGHNTTITSELVETRFRSKHELSRSMSGKKGPTMLSLQNSTVHVRQVTIDNNERESSIFLVESSTVLFEDGKLVSCGLESPFHVVNSEESSSRFGSTIVVSSSEIVWKDDTQPPLVDTMSTSAAISVFGSGLRFDSKILSSGTGPLFSFGLHPSTGEIVSLRPDSTTTTHLSACSLVNMSSFCASNCESLPSLKFGSCVSQTLLGCSLSRSSNHQSGTGMLDMNMGGSLLCQNSSFSHCTRTANSDEPEQYQHFTSTDPPYTLPPGATSVTFILCTFSAMTYAALDNHGGASISLRDGTVPLSISQCSFHTCTVTQAGNDGGAIHYYSTSTTGTGFSAIVTDIRGPSTISNCFFEKCWAGGRGGAVYLINTPSTITNCAFVGCYTNTYAGGLLFICVSSIDMTFVQFRGCSAKKPVSASDVGTVAISKSILNSTSVQFCDSTSGSPNVYHDSSGSSDGSLIPQVRPVTVASSSVKIVGTTATVSMTMSEKIKGKMGVLLEGANVPRLVFLTFGTSTTPSTTATADFALSTTTILPTLASGKTYKIRSWSFPYGQAGVDGVTSELVGTASASFHLSGYHFREGSYQMKVKTDNQNELTISLTSPSFSSLSGQFGMSATDSSKLRYAREYEVKSIVFNSTSLSRPSSLSFSIPYPEARLTKISQVNSTDWLALSFGGSGFVGESYIITLSGRDEDGLTHETTITRAPTSLTALPVVNMSLYPLDEASLRYGMEYTITSMISTDTFQNVVLDVTSFSTIPEPTRITSLTLTGYDELDKTAFFSVEGRVLVEGAKYRINVLSSSSAAFCFNFTASSTTGGEGSAILFSADPSKVELDYDTAYTVSRVEDAEGVELILHSTFTFSTIEEPGRVMRNGEAVALEDRNRTTVGLVGHNMQVGTFLLELVNVVDETEKPVITASFDSATTGQASASLHPSVELKSGETYRLVKMTTTMANARPVHVEPSLSFIVTDEPSRLTEIGTVVAEDSDRRVKIGLTGIKMTNGPFSLTLNNTKTLTATFGANGKSGSMSAILFSQEESKVDLKYDTEYTVTGLTDKENKPTFFHSSLSFRTPAEPTRLVKLNVAKYDDDETTIYVELVGSKLGTTGNYSVELSLDGDVIHTIDFSLTSESKWIGSALLYPSSSCELEYGKTYDVSNFTHTLNSVASSHFFEPNTLEIEAEPSRIEAFFSATLNKQRSIMTAKFTGRSFKSEMGPLLLKKDANTFESVGNVRFVDSTHCEADFMIGSSEPGLVYEQHYTLAAKDGQSSFFVNSDVSVRVPAPPLLTHVSFAPLNKLGVSGLVLFEGTDLEADTEYQITLEPSFSFTIRISDSTSASSSPLLVGWNDSLPFSTTFKIASITPVDPSDGDVILKSLLSFYTSDRPTELLIHLDSKSTDSSLFCGTFENPCSTIESGWTIVNGLRFARPTLGIIDSTTLSSQLTVSEGMHVLLTHGSNSEPTLSIPSSATHSEGSGLIVVTSASLEIVDVDIVLDSPLSSFVLISASSSGLLLKDGLITQKHQNTLPDSNSDICWWSTGIIQTTDCELNITDNKFTRISAGAINMKGGNLTLTSSSFSDNSPPDSSFTSIRRNIHCSGQGEIDLQILPTVGDGSKEYPSAWMSLEECMLSGKDAPTDAPLFVPTLSKSSQSILDKKAGHFNVQIEGKTLIPCELFLEVFEVSKDKSEGKSTNFELSQSSSTSFTETSIAFKLPLSKLASLDPNLEWRGRLVFGSDQITSESFVIQQNSQERMSQSVKDNMKWWLPLVIVIAASAILILFIIVLCCRRRNSKKEEGKKAKEEMDSAPEDLDIVKHDEYPDMASTIIDPTAHYSSFIDTKTEKSDPTNRIPPEPSISVIPGQVSVLKMEADLYGREVIKEGFVNAGDTLYNRLHGTGKDTPLDRKKMRHDLVNSLKQIYRVRPTASVFSKLSPFWVFLDKLDNLSVKLSDVGETELQGDIGQQGFSQNVKKVGDDGKRWEPPEQAECKAEVDTSKVAVFRLVLLLWEITTGQIPFGETDGVNAQRQVGIGVLPRMDEVRPAELVDLISDCLSLDPLNRPSLNDIEKRLSSIDSPTLVKENEAVHHPQRIEQVDHVFPGKPVKGNEAEEVWNDHEDHHTFSLSGTID
ncbi:hypothetical protein BLNAU_943 [Blattamonas nauphoetae]|uniref:Protein kinase domain-containing protein n=1 Tax=Blattamonas nauphoetae TaxID=2049346 RepID=A0ABQ9YJD2_9EUKA|nr:hypothetical protein BLNAU_943 [Blattamonas nauphoetae]